MSSLIVCAISSMPLVPPLRTQLLGMLVASGKILQRHALAILASRIGYGQLRHNCTDEHQDPEAVSGVN